MEKLFQVIQFTLVLLLASGCQSVNQYRNPSSSNPSAHEASLFELSPSQVMMLRQMMLSGLEPGEKKLNIKAQFTSDYRNRNFHERAKKTLRKAMAATFSNAQVDSDEKLADRIKANMIQSILEEFVLSLKFYKLVNGRIGYHIYLLPEDIEKNNFIDEFNSNNIVHLNEKVRFSKSMNENELKSLLPKSSESKNTEYLGGMVSLNIEFVDIGIPGKKQILKGEIQYRRFYRDQKRGYSVSLNRDSEPQIVLAKMPSDPLLTVDVVKTFNYEDLKPKLSHMSISYGEFNNLNEKIKTKPLGFYDSENKKVMSLSRLVYDFKKGDFDLRRSRSRNEGRRNTRGRSGKISPDTGNVLRELIVNKSNDLKVQLQLKRFWNEI